MECSNQDKFITLANQKEAFVISQRSSLALTLKRAISPVALFFNNKFNRSRKSGDGNAGRAALLTSRNELRQSPTAPLGP